MQQIKTIYCVTPVYNDWESFSDLYDNTVILQQEIKDQFLPKFVVVNDGSFEKMNFKKASIDVTILNLKINIGHQRAIAAGLQYVYN